MFTPTAPFFNDLSTPGMNLQHHQAPTQGRQQEQQRRRRPRLHRARRLAVLAVLAAVRLKLTLRHPKRMRRVGEWAWAVQGVLGERARDFERDLKACLELRAKLASTEVG